MSSYLDGQLDFIFFFYGLAFVLLGLVSIIIGKRLKRGRSWHYLAGFGMTHGLGEWFDLSTVVLGDTEPFAVFRTAWLAFSYILLAEFGRRQARTMGYRLVGGWIHVPLTIALVAVWSWTDTTAINALVRYCIGLPGSLAACWVFLKYAGSLRGRGRHCAAATAVGFALYGIAGGLVVPEVDFLWPSTVLNYENFRAATHMPIQLVRGLLACWIAVCAWAIWNSELAQEVSSERFTRYLRRQFALTISAMVIVLASGWTLTQQFGKTYRSVVEEVAESDASALVDRLNRERYILSAIAQLLATSPTLSEYFARPRGEEPFRADSEVKRYQNSVDADVVQVFDSRDLPIALAGNPRALSRTALDKALSSDTPLVNFEISRDSPVPIIYVATPIRKADGSLLGTVVVARDIAMVAEEFKRLYRPYFLLNPDGIVTATNVPDAAFRPFWPLSPDAEARSADIYAGFYNAPVVDRPLDRSRWGTVGGERDFLYRRMIADTGWSVVVRKPNREVFATRLVGIVITLLVALILIVYLISKERWMHEDVMLETQASLESLAKELGNEAVTDALTGLRNRARVNELMELEMTQSDLRASPLSVLMFDIDHFKTINDRFGHAEGDQVLVTLAAKVASQLRGVDHFIRWGGEEFLVILPGVDDRRALMIGEKIRGLCAQTDFGKPGSVTCSFGAAQYTVGETSATLLERADDALYRAKNGGRNRVEMAHETVERAISRLVA